MVYHSLDREITWRDHASTYRPSLPAIYAYMKNSRGPGSQIPTKVSFWTARFISLSLLTFRVFTWVSLCRSLRLQKPIRFLCQPQKLIFAFFPTPHQNWFR